MMPPPPPWQLFRTRFSFFLVQVFQWSGPSWFIFFRPKKQPFASPLDQRSTAHNCPFFILFVLASEEAFWFLSIFQPFSVEVASYRGTGSLYCARYFQFSGGSSFFEIFETQNLYSISVFFGFRVLVLARSCISFDCSCC